jgi:Spy/CpxP family protein refolding chaperone
MGWWKHARGEGHGHCGAAASCEAGEAGRGWGCHRRGHGREDDVHAGAGIEPDEMGAFGVRRPLRFLAHRLDLDESQVAKLAAILGDLKTERAQVAVDQRRRIAAIAEAMEAAVLDEAKLAEAGDEQVKSAERLRGAVSKALRVIHGILDEEQRKRFAYLLRTGVLSM